MRRFILAATFFLAINSGAYGKMTDYTDPVNTTDTYNSMLKGMIDSMVVNNFQKTENKSITAPPISAHLLNMPTEKYATNKSRSVKKHHQSKESAEFISEPAELTTVSKTFEYKGSQMWGEATAKIRTDLNSFEGHVTCSLLITMWTLKTPDGTILGQGRLRESQAFDFSIKEIFAPPYVLVLNVVYMDMPNQILVKMDKK
jgi:hypothetical protein